MKVIELTLTAYLDLTVTFEDFHGQPELVDIYPAYLRLSDDCVVPMAEQILSDLDAVKLIEDKALEEMRERG